MGEYIEFQISVSFQEGAEGPVWDIFKRYSHFVTLNDQLAPFASSLGIQLPDLPGPIPNQDQSLLNQNLNQRMQNLEEYLTKVLVLLTNRAPLPLLTFLEIHERSGLDFLRLDNLQKLTEISLSTKSLITINQSNIIVNTAGKAKPHFYVKLTYK